MFPWTLMTNDDVPTDGFVLTTTPVCDATSCLHHSTRVCGVLEQFIYAPSCHFCTVLPVTAGVSGVCEINVIAHVSSVSVRHLWQGTTPMLCLTSIIPPLWQAGSCSDDARL